MAQDEEANEHTHLLDPRIAELSGRRRSSQRGHDVHRPSSIVSSRVSKEEQELAGTAIGERLPYNDYTTIDWLHDLVGPIPCDKIDRLTVTSDQGLIPLSSH